MGNLKAGLKFWNDRVSKLSERDSLETQHPKFENSRLVFIESVHER